MIIGPSPVVAARSPMPGQALAQADRCSIATADYFWPTLFAASVPRCATWKREARQRGRFHFYAVAGRGRWHIAIAPHHHWMNKVFVEMVDIFNQPVVECGADSDVVKDRK